MESKRQGIIVYLHNLKHAKMLRKYGNVHYISRRLKYVVLYCDMEQTEGLMQKLKSLHFVKRVDQSYKPFLKLEYENSKQDKKEKEYEYKIGI
ncbi:YlbG family protein [Bacillus sp. HMF5848]|uniref:YlbG family protein n=1 Tax=Bacillus sp. HMF5848 TaxID=2495421 RepID=UPI0021AD7120|nr:DUF2129 domain-containing protein [Bacillus sp. HMF5848]